MAEITYQDCVKFVTSQKGVHYNKALTVLKLTTKVIQDHVKKGGCIQIPGLFTIQYRIKDVYIYENEWLTLDSLSRKVAEQTTYSEIDVFTMIDLYFRYLHDSVENGYKVTVKGIGSVEPFTEEDSIYLEGKISPCLKKPNDVDFLVIDKKDNIVLQQFTKKQLKFTFALDDKLKVPTNLNKERKPLVFVGDLV